MVPVKNMRILQAGAVAAILLLGEVSFAADNASPTVDQILNAYVTAVGGEAAIQRITSRECDAKQGHTSAYKLYWQAPDLVLRIEGKERQGFDGKSGWIENKKKKVMKLPPGTKDEMETDANPIRFVHLPDIYHDLAVDKPATQDGVLMDVITSPNAIGATKFFFSHADHLLYKIEDFGRASAYYKHKTEFEDYQNFDGVRVPTRIRRESDEPGFSGGELRLSKIRQNVELETSMFRKPDVGTVITAAKHQ